MTVNNNTSQLTSYQSISYSSFRINVFSATSQASTNPSSGATQPTDSVSLSPEATSQAAANTNTPASAPAKAAPSAAPVTTVATQVSATYVSATYVSATSTSPTTNDSNDDGSSALFKALDANQDGSVTEEEFKTGAKALLRRGRRNEHADGVRHGDHDHRGGRRLDRTLGRLFDAVDGDGDGNITKDELSAALGKVKNAQGPAQDPPPEPPAPIADPLGQPAQANTSSSASASYFSVTVVSVAIRSYTSVSQSATNTSNNTQVPPPATSADKQALPLAA